MYRNIVRPLLFRLDPETAHEITLEWLSRAGKFATTRAFLHRLYGSKVQNLPVEVMGIQFPNPLGLAAGLDKNARCIGAMEALGFGYIEAGTVTPKAQPGNPLPRIFRVPEKNVIVNRMGFNSGGISPFLENVANTRKHVPLGINLGKNATTPIEYAATDYVSGLRQLYLYADYFTINISSPNTKNLRDLQSADALDALLREIMLARKDLADEFRRKVPVAVKIAPDIENAAIPELASLLLAHGIDGVIATNTTIDHASISGSPVADEAGGLSGAPLKQRANEVVGLLFSELAGRIPIIGVGGIFDAEDAWQRMLAGADLLQIYTSFIYEGPGVIASIVNGLAQRVEQSGAESLADAVRQARAEN
jgi:dihydroorotate dehydrogenase